MALSCANPTVKFSVLCIIVLCILSSGRATPAPLASIPEVAISKLNSSHNDANYRFDRHSDPDVLPTHYWTLARHQNDIETFRAKYNLTLVTSVPQDAALLPSWPQALLQYFFIYPFLNFHSSSRHESWTATNSIITSYDVSERSINCFDTIQYILAPPCFIAWIISFARIQRSKTPSAGWISIMGWGVWIGVALDLGFFPALIFALFQWCASLVIIIQRWKRSIGSTPYKITDLHGCIPHDGLTFLQSGVRSRAYRIIQTVTFTCCTFYFLTSNPKKITENMNQVLGTIGFAELVYSSVIANKGIPMVVSGNCLLVELSPRLGYLDSSISTTWKALSGFMGF